MKMKTIVITSVTLFLSTLCFTACDPTTEPTGDSFDRKAMLQNYADNLIKPSFAELQSKVNALQTATGTFTTTVTEQNLTALQTAWKDAYTAFQYANAFNFGPAGEAGTRKKLVEEAGTFPVSTTKIESKIAANTTNLNDFDRDARGFLAVEYLLFNLQNDNAAIVTQFASAARRNYLTALSAKLKEQTDAVVTAWNDTYTTEFVNDNGTSAGSSTSQLYNEFVASFEAIKNLKLGLPLGKRAPQTEAAPQLVEAYYSGQSLPMLASHLTSIENIWYGRSRSGQDGVGFKEYLANVEGGPALITATETQLAAIRTAQNAVPTTTALSVQIAANSAPAESLYTELQKHVRYFKSDMSSLLGIAITFSSGDGD